MTNSKSTKKALLLSMLSLLLCFSMLIGTTFAWFTDSVSSANNRKTLKDKKEYTLKSCGALLRSFFSGKI